MNLQTNRLIVFTVALPNISKCLRKYSKRICFQNRAKDSEIMTSERNAQVEQARETFQMLFQISQLLNTGLDAETLTICIRLCELGVNPEMLALVIREIRKKSENVVQNKATNLPS